MSSSASRRRRRPATSSSPTHCSATRAPPRAAIEARGAALILLPAYSPDLNPIEQAFAKLKALVRAAAPRSVDALWNTIAACLARFTPEECSNYFANSGYPRLM